MLALQPPYQRRPKVGKQTSVKTQRRIRVRGVTGMVADDHPWPAPILFVMELLKSTFSFKAQFSSSFPNYENTKHFPKPKYNESSCLCALVRYLRDHQRDRGRKHFTPLRHPSEVGFLCSSRARHGITCCHQSWFDLKPVCPPLHSLCWP